MHHIHFRLNKLFTLEKNRTDSNDTLPSGKSKTNRGSSGRSLGGQPAPPPSLKPSRAAEEQPATKPPSESGLAFLASMGYSVDRCEHALRSAQVRCRDCHLFRFCTLGARFNVRAPHCILFFTRKITRNACDPTTREILTLRSNCFSPVRISRTQVLHRQKLRPPFPSAHQRPRCLQSNHPKKKRRQ